MRKLASVLCVILLGELSACSAPAPSESTQLSRAVLTQDWESGASGWTDRNGQPPTLVTDPSSTAGQTVQQINRATTGGDYSSPLIDVVGGQSYCIRAKIKWVSGAAPFVGLEQYVGGVTQGVNWLIGSRYTDGLGTTTVVSNSDPGWQEFSETLVTSYNTTQVRLVDELYQGGAKAGEPLAYFDGISIDSGSCAPATPLPYTEDWELGTGGWEDIDQQAPTLVSDTSSIAGPTVQQINRARIGGDYSSPLLDVAGGQRYCVRAKVKWSSGAAPFVGVEQYANHLSRGVSWLIGTRYTDQLGSTTVLSSSDAGWQEFQETLTTSYDTTQIRLVDELYQAGSKGGDPLAAFDGFSIDNGSCTTGTVPYTQNWEAGVGSWTDLSGQPPILATDASSPAGPAVQQLNRTTTGGDYFSPFLDVVGGQRYCVRAKVKWVSGAAPFVGVEQYVNRVSWGVSWLMGTQYVDSHGNTTVLSSTETGWQDLARTLFVSYYGTTQIRLVDELYQAGSKGGNPLAYIDGISVENGLCTPMPYTQDWEAGDGKWKDLSGQAPTLVSDSSSPEGPTVQQLNRATTGGDYFSPMLDVQPYESYCIRAKLKWVSGAAPFVGVEQYGNGVSHGVSWLIGTPYTDWRGSTRPISSTNAGWQEVGNTLQISYNTTRIRLVDELYQAGTKGGDPLAYFDGISVDNGSCTLPYIEDWESGTGGWKDLNGQAPALVTDASSPSGQAVQQVNRAMATAGGDYFSPRLEVVGGSSYCIRANLKWLSGAAPFVGIEQFANGNSQGINWLIGSKYTDAKGSTTVVSNTDTGWQTLETPLSLSENTTQVRLVDALFETGSKGGDPLADFDGISINTNYCWNNPPTVNMSTDKSNYLVGEPVVVNWSSRNPIGGQLQLSSGDSFSVAPALAGSHTFQNLPAGSYAMYFSYVASWYSTQIATTTFNIATGTTDKTEYLLGTPVVVNWGNLGASSGRVVIALVGSAPSSAGVASTNADLSTPGTYTFTDIPVGDYEVRFLDGSSNPIGTASTTISVYSKFAAAQPSLVPYDFIVATWRDVTPNAQDWVAIAPDSSSDATVTDWAYTGGVDGSHAFGPLAAGTYRARYFQSGTNTKLYESEAIQVKTLTPASFTYVDASDYHVCGVTPEHKVKCWGANWYGQLGNGTYLDSPSLVEVAGISTATAVGTGDYHTCAVTSDGKVHCWGANWYGQLGNGPSNDSTVPVEVAGISTATAVGTGDYHTCAMTSDGKVHCWGANWYGELGDGTATDSTMPVEVAGISNASAVRAGASHTCAVTSGGKVHCWGMNEDGQLGDGTSTDSTIPVEVVGISTATAVAAAAHHSCAVTIDGKVHCWGANGQGQLGNGTTVDSPTPVEVAGISTAVAVNLDDDHSCARLSDGTARCWGYNGYGQLGNGTRSYDPSSTAVEVVGVTNALGIYASGTRSCALLNTGVLQCWGDNSQGFLGDGTYGSTTEMGGVGNTNSISAGGNHVCASLIDGHVRCWGYNGNGQLGDGTTADRNTPVEVTLTAVADVNAGYYHTCTLGTDGRVHCWGTNGNGQLGDGTTTDSAIPVGVSGISAATAVGAGGSHTCALTSDGKVRCWGANWNGQLGDGTTNDSAIPVEVAGISTATAVSAGGMYTCALTSDGKVRCWGANGNGQLGDGTENDSAIAVEVAGISTATAVGGGNFHTCALTNNGKVMCWGYNGNGQLGNKTIPESFTPVEVVGITNAVSIDLGDSHSCARLNDGKVMCWGANWYGQLGDGTTTDRNIPIEMGGIDNAIAVSTGYYDTCVWHSNDKLRCWGDNSYGQFGDGKHPYALTPVTVMSLQ